MDEHLLQITQREVMGANRLLVVSHVRPDGDAIGSLIGLGLSLQAAGKDVHMVSPDGVPATFSHLAGSDQVSTQPEGHFDLIIVVDCSDLERVGNVLDGFSIPDINIDHHPTNSNFARLNLVETKAVATAEMLAEYLPLFGLPVTTPVADALLYGIITDTLGFRTHNMTPRALRIAANLMEAGGNLPFLYHQALLKRSFEAARYWGAGLSGLHREGRLAWTSLTLADRRAVGYPGRDDADLNNILSTVEDVDVVVVFVEQGNGHIKVSWRSLPEYDVSQVALRFGGGGHTAAAGADVEGSLEEAQAKVLPATRALLNQN